MRNVSADMVKRVDADPELPSELRKLFVYECYDPMTRTPFEKFIVPGTSLGTFRVEDMLAVLRLSAHPTDEWEWRPRLYAGDVRGVAYQANWHWNGLTHACAQF